MEIVNYNLYNDRMTKTFNDKMFFMDKIHISKLFDFGCANGLFLKEVKDKYLIETFGYDIDKNMLSEAKLHTKCYDNWEQFISNIDNNSVLNLSSVIHEIYSYSSETELSETLYNIFNSNFKYITIRDMMPTNDIDTIPLDKNDLDNLYRYANDFYLNSFEHFYGKISSYRMMIHYLLKYKYTENWEREMRENYLPINVDDFMKLVPSHYRIKYFETFALPYTKEQVMNDFNIDIQCNTHVKMILENINI